MRAFVIAALLNSGSALSKQWPSVARCADGKTSTDFEACDHMNNQEMQHDAIPPSQHKQLIQRYRRDTFDSDPDTSSMYDDGWVYSKPGKFKAGTPPTPTGKEPAKVEEKPMSAPNPAAPALLQRSYGRKDTFDNDPDTASMYDDGWVYSHPGKFQRGDPMAGISHKQNAEWKDEKPFFMTGPKEGALSQRFNTRKDTFDNDPDTASMYDDGWVYSKPGKFQRGDPMAGISRKQNAEWKDEKPFFMTGPKEGSLSQRFNVRKDTFDNDPDTASMYDDGWVYSHPGKFQRGDPMAGISHKQNAEWKDEKPFFMTGPKEGALTQESWPSVARCADGKTSTDFEACDHMNNQEMQHDAIPPSQHAQ